jgi:hypothetical protein
MNPVKLTLYPSLAFGFIRCAIGQNIYRIFEPEYTDKLQKACDNPCPQTILYKSVWTALKNTYWSKYTAPERMKFIVRCPCYEFLFAIASVPRNNITDEDLVKATCEMFEADEFSRDEDEIAAIVKFALGSYGNTPDAFLRMVANLEPTESHIAFRVAAKRWDAKSLRQACNGSTDSRVRNSIDHLLSCIRAFLDSDLKRRTDEILW